MISSTGPAKYVVAHYSWEALVGVHEQINLCLRMAVFLRHFTSSHCGIDVPSIRVAFHCLLKVVLVYTGRGVVALAGVTFKE